MVKKFDSACSQFSGLKFRRVLVCFAAFSLAAFTFSACHAAIPGDKLAKPESRLDAAGIREKLGIKPVAIRLTAAGSMIDFRYSVVDPQKSLPLFDRKIKTYLVNQSNGDKFAVPTDTKIGPLRSSSREPEAGREYFIFFVNPGKLLKRGNKVTVVVGDMKIENLTLE